MIRRRALLTTPRLYLRTAAVWRSVEAHAGRLVHSLPLTGLEKQMACKKSRKRTGKPATPTKTTSVPVY